jgi:nicotinate dehydrogenase subunit B
MKKEKSDIGSNSIIEELPDIKRRSFFKLLGGGIFIFFGTWDPIDVLAAPAKKQEEATPNFNAFLRVDENGIVSGYTGKIEMGQGPVTSLVQELAEELDVSFDQVKLVMVDTDLCPWDDGTWGSTSTRFFGQTFRAAAAEAKAILLQLGSEKMHVPVTQLEVKEGVIIDKLNRNNRVTYGQLTKGRKIERFMDKKPPLKDPADFKIMGKPRLRHDSRLKVTGQAKYSGDFLPQGILFARILRPPSHGATLVSVSTEEAEKLAGIKVIRDGDLIAVLHEHRDKVDEAITKVKGVYSFDEMKVDDKSVYTYLLNSGVKGNIVEQAGDLSKGKSLSKTFFSKEYDGSYVAHSPIETHTALAYMESDRVIVRGSTQTPFPAREEIANALKIPKEKVQVIVPFVGGGFGGKSANQQMVEAARLTKLTGKPVMVVWTRKEEFFYDNFRAASVIKINSGMDDTGKITMWDYHVYFAGDRGADTYYDVAHRCTTAYDEDSAGPKVHPFATGPWRAPGNSNNTFARESQIEIMAAAAGIDPLEFRLKNLKDEKLIAVLKATADKFGWTPAKGPSGRGFGIACGSDAGSYVAVIAEVKVDKETGHVQVVRVACAQDMGLCVNPQGATIQMEGCIIMGMGYTLTEEILFRGGKISTQSLYSYELPRFSWVPKIDTLILDRQDQPPQGGGEPAIICMGGVIANAIFDATGARLYQLPMTLERVLEAIKKG